MKKIGIITFHFANNAGAVLQCLALNEKLHQMGFQPFVINYRPKYHIKKYSAWKPPLYLTYQYIQVMKIRQYSRLKLLKHATFKFIGILFEDRRFFFNRKRTKKFNYFVSENLQQSKCYLSLKELQKSPPNAEAYICGSDQIWNKALTNEEYDLAYFLQFGSGEIVRVAYAASMGETDILHDSKEFRKHIADLDHVFMREEVDCLKISQLTGKTCANVKDPTLLLTVEDYSKYEKDVTIPENYIFVYTVLKSEAIKALVKTLIGDRRLHVIDGSTHRYISRNNSFYYYDGLCGPGEFLSYIKGASLVITNSFHGTVFSILYRKNFVTAANKKRNSRIEELLKCLGLENRMIYSDKINLFHLSSIDYSSVEQKLSEIRKHDSTILSTCFTSSEVTNG
jgi:hypothetical protein